MQTVEIKYLITLLHFICAIILWGTVNSKALPVPLLNINSNPLRPALQTTVEIPDITQHGYRMVKAGIDENGMTHKWNIYNAGNYNVNPLNTFGYTPAPQIINTLWIYEAWNGKDNTPNRLKLRDLMLGWWKAQSGIPVDQIIQIFWSQCEPGTDVSLAVSQAYDLMGVAEDQELNVNADAGTSREQKAFQGIAATKLGKGITSMCREYAEFAGRRINSFNMKEHKSGPAFDLWIDLAEDDKTPPPVQI